MNKETLLKRISLIVIALVVIAGILLFTFCVTTIMKNGNQSDTNLRVKSDALIEETVGNKAVYDGWVASNEIHIMSEPSDSSKVVGTMLFNSKIEYTVLDENWFEIEYDDTVGYVPSKYISDSKTKYKSYSVPSNSGFKSYMDYKYITATDSAQYQLQHSYAQTSDSGIRTVNDRYCIAVGSYFTDDIGQYIDLILENGTVIQCVLADQKADAHTDRRNMFTNSNGCLSEFVVDTNSLNDNARIIGDISYCNSNWNSPVKEIKVYDKNIFDEQ